MRDAIRKMLLTAGFIAASTAAYAEAFSTSATNPTPAPASWLISGNYPAGQSDSNYYFVVDLKAGDLASQISIRGGAQYKSLDFVLLDGNGRRIDTYFITGGANENSEATRVFPIDASGKHLVKLTTKGPETASFRVALGGSALPNRQAPAEPAGGSHPFLAPTPVGPNGVVTGPSPWRWVHLQLLFRRPEGRQPAHPNFPSRAGRCIKMDVADCLASAPVRQI
jgi:hypothetical protein